MTAPHARDVAALLAVIEDRSARPFGWARGDCCVSFMAACVEAQTRIDVLGALTWSNRREAIAVVNGLGGLHAAMDARFDRIAPAMARRGDIAGIEDRLLGVQLAIVEGATLVAPGDHGLMRVGREAMRWAWDAGSAREVAA